MEGNIRDSANILYLVVLSNLDWDFGDEDTQQKVRDVLKAGRSVYSGYVCYEECDYHYAKVFEKIWEIMKEHGEDDFVKIDGDLSY